MNTTQTISTHHGLIFRAAPSIRRSDTQEIEEVFPELVQTRENGYKAVKYDKLVSVLIEGIKELTKQVEYLKTKIEN